MISRRLLVKARRLIPCWIQHRWRDITKPVKMVSWPEGVDGYCQRWHEFRCKKCKKVKGFLGDVYGGCRIVDEVTQFELFEANKKIIDENPSP